MFQPNERKKLISYINIKYLILILFLISLAIIFGAGVALSPIAATVLILIPMGILSIVALPYANEKNSILLKDILLYTSCAYIFLFIVWPRYVSISFPGFPDINIQRLAFVLLMIVWVYCLSTVPSTRDTLKHHISKNLLVFWLFVLLFLWKAIGIVTSVGPISSSVLFANEFINYFLLLMILLSSIKCLRDAEKLMFTVLLGGIVVVAVGLLEGVTKTNYIVSLLSHGFSLSPDYIDEAMREKLRGGSYRVQSVFEHPLLLGEFLLILFPVSCYFAFFLKVKYVSVVAATLLPLIFVVSLYSGSRSAILVLCGLVVILILFYSLREFHQKKKISSIIYLVTLFPLIIGVLYVFSDIALELIQGRSLQEWQSSNARLIMLELSLPIISDSPFLGHGIGFAAELVGFAGRENMLTIDSYYLSIAVESGLPALILLLLLFYLFIMGGFKSWFRGAEYTNTASGIIGISLVGILVIKSILSVPNNWPLVYVLFSILMVLRTYDIDKTKI